MESLLNRIIFIIVLVLLGMGLSGAERGSGLPPTQREVVAMTILGEARGEGMPGMYAVATVISQRAINRNITPRQVCLQNRIVKGKRIYQFSCWNNGDVNKGKLAWLYLTHPMRNYATRLAMMITELERSYTKNADHYCHKSLDPYWSYRIVTRNGVKEKRHIKPVIIIKNHKFYKLRNSTNFDTVRRSK